MTKNLKEMCIIFLTLKWWILQYIFKQCVLAIVFFLSYPMQSFNFTPWHEEFGCIKAGSNETNILNAKQIKLVAVWNKHLTSAREWCQIIATFVCTTLAIWLIKALNWVRVSNILQAEASTVTFPRLSRQKKNGGHLEDLLSKRDTLFFWKSMRHWNSRYLLSPGCHIVKLHHLFPKLFEPVGQILLIGSILYSFQGLFHLIHTYAHSLSKTLCTNQ